MASHARLATLALLLWFPGHSTNNFPFSRIEPDDFLLVELPDLFPLFEDPDSRSEWPMWKATIRRLRLPGGRVAHFQAVIMDGPFCTDERRRGSAYVSAMRRVQHLKAVWDARDVGQRTYYVESEPDGKHVYCFVMKAVIGKYAGSLMFTGRTAEEARVTPAYLVESVEAGEPRPVTDREPPPNPSLLWVKLSVLAGVNLLCLWFLALLWKRRAGGWKSSRPS
jgi:hypothetical protein